MTKYQNGGRVVVSNIYMVCVQNIMYFVHYTFIVKPDFRKPNGYNHNIYLHIYILDQFSLMIRIEPIESEPIRSEPIRSEQT